MLLILVISKCAYSKLFTRAVPRLKTSEFLTAGEKTRGSYFSWISCSLFSNYWLQRTLEKFPLQKKDRKCLLPFHCSNLCFVYSLDDNIYVSDGFSTQNYEVGSKLETPMHSDYNTAFCYLLGIVKEKCFQMPSSSNRFS